MNKVDQYSALVARRKAYDPSLLGLENPATIAAGEYDSLHVGPWTTWAHDLNADLMVVGQDWGDVRYFTVNRGLDKPKNPTNVALADLLKSVGQPIPDPPSATDLDAPARSKCGVWLTNALPWLKKGGMSAAVREEWFDGFAGELLREQVAIVQPRVVVALGQLAHNCLLRAYGLPKQSGPFRTTVDDANGVGLPTGGESTTLFGVYHCGARIRNTVRPMAQQFLDWQRVKRVLRHP